MPFLMEFHTTTVQIIGRWVLAMGVTGGGVAYGTTIGRAHVYAKRQLRRTWAESMATKRGRIQISESVLIST